MYFKKHQLIVQQLTVTVILTLFRIPGKEGQIGQPLLLLDFLASMRRLSLTLLVGQ